MLTCLKLILYVGKTLTVSSTFASKNINHTVRNMIKEIEVKLFGTQNSHGICSIIFIALLNN